MSPPAGLGGARQERPAWSDGIARAQSAPSATAAPPATVHDPDSCPMGKVLNGVGHLTRQLHDTLSELGYDRQLQSAAIAMPDARQRLAYVATLTEQAASRTLNAIEVARPIQDQLGVEASALSSRWDALLRSNPGVEDFKALAATTRGFLRGVPERAQATSSQLHEIMMAQDFQDLTGQVIKKITDLAQHLERQLLMLLVENAPEDRRSAASGLLNGPVVDGTDRDDVVTGQAQVDELLESLGF